jgi:hypothetical protein
VIAKSPLSRGRPPPDLVPAAKTLRAEQPRLSYATRLAEQSYTAAPGGDVGAGNAASGLDARTASLRIAGSPPSCGGRGRWKAARAPGGGHDTDGGFAYETTGRMSAMATGPIAGSLPFTRGPGAVENRLPPFMRAGRRWKAAPDGDAPRLGYRFAVGPEHHMSD